MRIGVDVPAVRVDDPLRDRRRGADDGKDRSELQLGGCPDRFQRVGRIFHARQLHLDVVALQRDVRFRDSERALILVNPSQRIRKLLQVARLAELFPTYESVDAAIAGESQGH